MKNTIASDIAQTIVTDLRSAITDAKFQPRIWQPAGKESARIYTGNRGEYLEIAKDGRVTPSQTNIAWGHIIDDVLADDPMAPLAELGQ